MFSKVDRRCCPDGRGKGTSNLRFHLVAGDVFSLSDHPADHVQAERIAALLKRNLAGPSGRPSVQTVVIDSLTAIVTPLVVEAILANAAKRTKNRIAAFKPKALTMRLLQDTVTSWGCDVLWIYHLRNGLDGHARQVESTTISGPEAAIAWGFEQGCFRDAVHAANAYAKVKREQAPKTAAAMWQVWIEEVALRKRAGEGAAVPLLSP